MIKGGVIIGIGTVILVLGLTGLGLLQTGVIHSTEVKSPEPAPAATQQPQGPVNQTAPAAAPVPQSGVGPGTQTGADHAEGAVQGQQPPSGNLAAEKPAPVPEAGQGERCYPKRDQVAQPRPSQDKNPGRLSQGARRTGKPNFDERRTQARLKSELERYAHKRPPAGAAQPVVIRFNFDPARGRGLNVAQVHSGDKIMVKVRRVGHVGRRVHFTFSKDINSPQGAVLKLEARHSFGRPVTYRTGRGFYVIEVKIYPGNRWNIKPRSFV